MKKPTVEERFWAKVEKTATCWNWIACKMNGYGRFGISAGNTQQAHRVSYEFSNGPIPNGLVIDHRCHNKACVNPDHLRAVTHKQNMENRGGPAEGSRSGVRGVSWSKPLQKWVVYITHQRKSVYVGLFSDRQEAGAAALAKRNELFTHNDMDRAA